MRNKTQTIIIAALSAGIVLLIGGLLVGLAGFYLFTPVAEARTEAAPLSIVQTQTESSGGTITVVGEGKVSAKPDIAQANIGVEVIGPDVKQTSADAAAAMEQLLAALKAQGVADDDIQTSYFNVWVERPFSPQGSSGGGEVIYHVNNNVMVTIRDLTQVTTTLGAAIEAGANNINSVNFNLSDPDSLRSEARQKAVDNAVAKAGELAALNGVEIGEVISVSEVIGSASPLGGQFAVAEAAGVGGGAGPLLPGDVDVTVRLQVTYAIQ